jgi:anti-sigma factor RsiW
MRCPSQTQDGAELLLAYSTGELDPKSAADLEIHLRGCAPCREFTEAQREVWEALDEWKAAPVSPGFDRRLFEKIDRDAGWWGRIMRPFRPLPVRHGLPIAASAVLVIAAGFLVERSGGPVVSTNPAAQVETLPAEQAEPALQEMEIMREFSHLIRQEPADPKM